MISPTKVNASGNPARLPSGEDRRQRKSHLFTLFVVAWIVSILSFAVAQETSPDANSQTTGQVEVVTDEPPSTPLDSDASAKPKVVTEKMKKVTILLSAIIGIVIFGVGGIAVMMLWARRIRRLARDPGPVQKTVGNDFWFLKPPKPTVSDSNVLDGHRPAHSSPEEAPPE